MVLKKEKKQTIPVPEQIKLLAQGSYGCVYRRGIACSGKMEKPEFITKIQKHRKNSDKETRFGKKIMDKYPTQYANYFAPILSSCPIVLANVDSNEIAECDFLKKSAYRHEQYDSNRMLYVGKVSLGDYLSNSFLSHPSRFLITFSETYKNILLSLKKLEKIRIVHNDIKENNILMSDRTGKPIIIDFGLSFDIGELKKGDRVDGGDILHDTFYAYDGFECAMWPIESAFCCYIDKLDLEKGSDSGAGAWKTQFVTEEQIDEVIDNFFKFNRVFGKESKLVTGSNPLFTAEDIENYRTLHKNMFRTRFLGKPWQEAVIVIIDYSLSWDNYGAVVMLSQLLYDMRINELEQFKPFLEFFKHGILLKGFDERPTSEIAYREYILKLAEWTNIKKPTMNMFRALSKDRVFVESQQKNMKNAELQALKQDEKLYSQQAPLQPIF
jgi:serine/threonine protein kinase